MEHINTRAAWSPFLGPIARTLVTALVANALGPLVVLAQTPQTMQANALANPQVQRGLRLQALRDQARQRHNLDLLQAQRSPSETLDAQLVRIQDIVSHLNDPKLAGTPQYDNLQSQLPPLLGTLLDTSAAARAEFDGVRAELLRKNVGPAILARHDEALAQFDSRAQFQDIAAQFNRLASASAVQAWPLPLATLDSFLQKNAGKRRATPLDPTKLPWGPPPPNKSHPATTKAGWVQQLSPAAPAPTASLATLERTARSPALPTQASTVGGIRFTLDPEPGQAPTEADLAETDETRLTPALRAKALELGHNPVRIADWVRNQIDYVPTWGSIQSAQDTLDTASLLVALLRASSIPARYQTGTIEIPAAQAMNWVGGATTPAAAQQILARCGIAIATK